MLSELKGICKHFPELKDKHWYKLGDWQSSVLRKDLYLQGNKASYFFKITGTQGGLDYEIHKDPGVYSAREDNDYYVKIWMNNIRKDNKLFERVIRKFERRCQKAEEFVKKIKRTKNWKTKSNKELRQWYKLFLADYMPLFPYSFFCYQFDKFYKELFKYAIGISQVDLQKASRYRQQLLSSNTTKLTYSEQALSDLYEIASYVEARTKLKKLFSSALTNIKRKIDKEKKLQKMINDYIENYGWITTRHWLGEPLSLTDVIKQIKALNLIEAKAAQKKRAEDFELKQAEFLQAKEKLGLSAESVALLQMIRYQLYFKTYRKELISKVDFAARGLFFEVGRRAGLSYQQLIYLSKAEFEGILLAGKKPDKKQIALRQKGFAIILDKENIYVLNAKAIGETKGRVDTNRIKIIKGQTANPGVVRGRVRLVLNNADIDKVKKGEIIVADMTNPNYFMALQKATAFVVNRGGLLSHAAILSRELKKPCIVGTKNATEVFRNGDKIEVDADKGVIKKIK